MKPVMPTPPNNWSWQLEYDREGLRPVGLNLVSGNPSSISYTEHATITLDSFELEHIAAQARKLLDRLDQFEAARQFLKGRS